MPNLALLCCCGASCEACLSTGTCASRLGHSSVVCDCTLTFDAGFPAACFDCDGNQVYSGEDSFDFATDIGSLTLYATTSGACSLTRSVAIFGSPWAWSPGCGTYPGSDPCETGQTPTICPWYLVAVYCIETRSGAYAEAAVTLQRPSCSGFGIELGTVYYRKPMDGDCHVPLGEFTYHRAEFATTWLDTCGESCSHLAWYINNLAPGTLTLS